MFESAILDVALGLSLVYLMLSLVSSTVSEWIAQVTERRGKDLEESIRRMLAAPMAPPPTGASPGLEAVTTELIAEQSRAAGASIADRVLAHPIIAGLGDDVTGRARKIEYIPARAFVAALFDVIAPATGQRRELEQLRASVAGWPASALRTRMLALIDQSEGSLESVHERMSRWFDGAMEGVSRVYKRNTRVVLFGVGGVLAIITNADSISLATRLQHDQALRRAVAQAAVSVDKVDGSIKVDDAQLRRLDLLFWDGFEPRDHDNASLNNPRAFQSPEASLGWVGWLFAKLLGLSLTALAVSLGAPFWFDLTRRIGGVRAPPRDPAA